MDQEFAERLVSLLPRLRGFARALARSSADGDDLVQATCEKALAAQASWKPGTRLDSWMFRIMQNHWIDTRRRMRADVPVEGLPEGALGFEDGRQGAEARLALREVSSAAVSLPEEQRAVLLLVCVEEMSYRETAEILDVPIGTVMSRLARGRRALLQVMEPDAGYGLHEAKSERAEAAR